MTRTNDIESKTLPRITDNHITDNKQARISLNPQDKYIKIPGSHRSSTRIIKLLYTQYIHTHNTVDLPFEVLAVTIAMVSCIAILSDFILCYENVVKSGETFCWFAGYWLSL